MTKNFNSPFLHKVDIKALTWNDNVHEMTNRTGDHELDQRVITEKEGRNAILLVCFIAQEVSEQKNPTQAPKLALQSLRSVM